MEVDEVVDGWHGWEEGEGTRNEPQPAPALPRRSSRVPAFTQKYREFFGLETYSAESSEPLCHPCNLLEPVEPQTYEEAISGPHAEEWKASIQDEYDSHIENGTWEYAELPPGS